MTLNAYSPAEERINIGSHALGLVLSIVALLLLVLETLPYKNPLRGQTRRFDHQR